MGRLVEDLTKAEQEVWSTMLTGSLREKWSTNPLTCTVNRYKSITEWRGLTPELYNALDGLMAKGYIKDYAYNRSYNEPMSTSANPVIYYVIECDLGYRGNEAVEEYKKFRDDL